MINTLNFTTAPPHVPASQNSKPSILSLPNDLENLILTTYLKPWERRALSYVDKRFYYRLKDLRPLKTPENCIKILESAAKIGSLPYINWLVTHWKLNQEYWKVLAREAAFKGCKNVLIWMKDQGLSFDKGIPGSLGHGSHSPDVSIGSNAAEAGHLDTLKWLYANGYHVNYFTFKMAVKSGHLEMLKWLKEQKCEIDIIMTSTAAQYGHLDVLKWLKENNFPLYEFTFTQAVKGGNLEMLTWLDNNGCPKSSLICAEAAAVGNFEVLKWLREKKCPWDYYTHQYFND